MLVENVELIVLFQLDYLFHRLHRLHRFFGGTVLLARAWDCLGDLCFGTALREFT
jgi:hypothetical protein